MKASSREMGLGLTALAALLFGVTAVFIRPRIADWRDLRAQQESIRGEIALDRRMVEQHEQWRQRFETVSEALPVFGADVKMDVHWLSVIDKAARRHRVEIRRLEAERERQIGDIYELPIDCKDWEGTLDALVHFLFDLQSRGAMLDIRHLLVRPKSGKVLRGRFYLFCAYAREQESAPSDGEP